MKNVFKNLDMKETLKAKTKAAGKGAVDLAKDGAIRGTILAGAIATTNISNKLIFGTKLKPKKLAVECAATIAGTVVASAIAGATIATVCQPAIYKEDKIDEINDISAEDVIEDDDDIIE